MKAEWNIKAGLMHFLPEKPIEGRFLEDLFCKNVSLSKSSLYMIGRDVKQLTFKIHDGGEK